MKVILVTPITLVRPDLQHVPRPEVGDVDVVIETLEHENGDTYYTLERFGSYYLYMANLFAALSDAEQRRVTNEETLLQTA